MIPLDACGPRRRSRPWGTVVKKTRLTDEFPLAVFESRQEDGVILFARRDGALSIVTEDSKLPESGVTLVALVRETDLGERQERNARKTAAKAAGASRVAGE